MKVCECKDCSRVVKKARLCKRCYMSEYRKRPGVKEHEKMYRRGYTKRPEVQRKRREYESQPDVRVGVLRMKRDYYWREKLNR